MSISSATSIALAHLVFISSDDQSSAKGPITVRDRDEAWLVVGPFVTNEAPGIVSRQAYIFFKKTDAEVIGIGCCFEYESDPKTEAEWRRSASPESIANWDNRPEVTPFAPTLDLHAITHGGLINRADHAVAYAAVLLEPSGSRQQNLSAEEDDGVWKISSRDRSDGPKREVLTFSRHNGKVLSGTF